MMLAVPSGPAVASPFDPTALEIVALGPDVVHVALCVRFWVDPSVYVPVAVNCCVNPVGTDCIEGVTAIDTRTAGVAVRVAVPEMHDVGSVAVMTEEPRLTDVAYPTGMAGAFATAIDPGDDTHVALLVRF